MMTTSFKKVIPIHPLTAWSFSRYTDYCECPLKFKLKHLARITEPPNPAMKRGSDIHTMAEQYIKGLLPRLPTELSQFKTEFKELKGMYKLKSIPVMVEENWAFTKTWGETQWNDWAGCYLRIKLDVAYYESDTVMEVVDWKTGKFRPESNAEYLEQLELYALAALVKFPHLTEVRPRLVYLDAGIVFPPDDAPLVFLRTQVTQLKKTWEKRVAPMFKDKTFVPKPHYGCMWCYYGQAGKAKGGPGICKF